MLRRVVVSLTLTAFLAAGAAATAAPAAALKSDPPRECTDDDLTNRCSDESRRKQRALYGEAAIESLAPGAVVRRAFIVNGYGQDLVAISFERLPGRDARVRVRSRRFDEADTYVEMQAAVPLSLWNEVIGRSENFDRVLAPIPAGPEDEVVICGHPWVATVEAVDADGAVRHQTQSACGAGLAVEYAFALAAAAVKLLPACDALREDQHRNSPSRLQTCGLLEGDRLSAAQAFNSYLASTLQTLSGPASELGVWRDVHQSVILTWSGGPVISGYKDVSEAWVVRMATLLRPNLDFHRIIGVNSQEAVVEGSLTYDIDGSRDYYEAPVRTVWRDEGGGAYRAAEIVVGAFKKIEGK